jgi:hypothetical protein
MYDLSEISGSHGSEYEDGCLLGCYTMYSDSIIRVMIITLMMEAVNTSETSVNF